jgi:integrase
MSTHTPKYRLHKPTGQGVVTLNGRDFYLGAHGPRARAAYDRLVGEWLVNHRQIPRSNQPTDRTITELVVAYVEYADEHYVKDGKPTGEATTIRYALKPLRRIYGDTLARDFGPLALKNVRQHFIDAGLCRNEVNRRTRIICRAFKWAASCEMVPGAVHQNLKTVDGIRKGSGVRESAKVRPVPREHVDAIQAHVFPQVWTMVQLQLLTGMRSQEVTGMRTGDIDRSGPTWVYVPGSHKTEHHDHERRIFIGPAAQEVLKPWLRADPDAYLFQPCEAIADFHAKRRAARKTKMWASHAARNQQKRKRRPRKAPGKRYETGSYRQAVANACKDAGIPAWHPHRLRHSCATYLRSKFGPDVARTVLGQTTLDATEFYAEQDMDAARAAMQQVG